MEPINVTIDQNERIAHLENMLQEVIGRLEKLEPPKERKQELITAATNKIVNLSIFNSLARRNCMPFISRVYPSEDDSDVADLTREIKSPVGWSHRDDDMTSGMGSSDEEADSGDERHKSSYHAGTKQSPRGKNIFLAHEPQTEMRRVVLIPVLLNNDVNVYFETAANLNILEAEESQHVIIVVASICDYTEPLRFRPYFLLCDLIARGHPSVFCVTPGQIDENVFPVDKETFNIVYTHEAKSERDRQKECIHITMIMLDSYNRKADICCHGMFQERKYNDILLLSDKLNINGESLKHDSKCILDIESLSSIAMQLYEMDVTTDVGEILRWTILSSAFMRIKDKIFLKSTCTNLDIYSYRKECLTRIFSLSREINGLDDSIEHTHIKLISKPLIDNAKQLKQCTF